MQLENSNYGNYDPKRKCLKLWQHKAKYINFSGFILAKITHKVRSVVKMRDGACKENDNKCLSLSLSSFLSPALLLSRVAAKKPVDKSFGFSVLPTPRSKSAIYWSALFPVEHRKEETHSGRGGGEHTCTHPHTHTCTVR